MTDTQLYLAIGIPIVAVLTSLTISLLQVFAIRADVARIHGDMNGMRADFREDVNGIHTDFRADMLAIRTDIRADMLAIRTDIREDMRAIRTDLNILTGKVVEIDNRLTRIEERLEHR